jgi:uncharacterized protein (TIGR03437 family)
MTPLCLDFYSRWPTIGVLLVLLLTASARGTDSLAIVNAADYSPVVAPGSLITIFGSGLSATTRRAESLPLPLALDGVEVKANGKAIPLLFVGPKQINAQLPSDVEPGTATITVGGLSGLVNVQAAAPGLFRFGGELAWPNEVMPGGTVALYGTGLGMVSPPVGAGDAASADPLAVATAAVSARIGGQSAKVVFAGLAPGLAGVAQWNIKVPALPQGVHDVTVTVGDVESKAARLRVASTRSADLLRQQWSQNRCAGEGPAVYSVLPMEAENVAVFLPLGMMTDAHVTPIDHQYLGPKNLALGRDAYAVRAPAAGTIVSIQHRTNFVGDNIPANRTDEYRVVIEHSCSFWTYFDLLTSIDPAILAGISPQPGSGPWTATMRMRVEAGQTLGRIGGQTLDLGSVNAETILPGFLVPDHYIREPWKIHTVDPLDYFVASLRGLLLNLNPRRAEPRGGKIDYDIEGRLAGNWFREGTNGYAGADPQRPWAGHLAVAPHYLDPAYFTISLGDYDGRSRQFWARGNAPDPAAVSVDSGLVKFELVPVGVYLQGRESPTLVYSLQDDQVQGVLLVQMLDARRMRAEAFPGKRAADVSAFTSAAAVYER